MHKVFVAGMVSVSLFSGCASITSSDMQPVNVATQSLDGSNVEKVQCTLHNDKGFWKSESPSIVSVHRSAEDLLVECKKDGYPDGILKAISRAAGGMWGNIVFGGGIGAIVDHSRGTGYNYPDNLIVKMGGSVVTDRRDSNKSSDSSKGSDPATITIDEKQKVSKAE